MAQLLEVFFAVCFFTWTQRIENETFDKGWALRALYFHQRVHGTLAENFRQPLASAVFQTSAQVMNMLIGILCEARPWQSPLLLGVFAESFVERSCEKIIAMLQQQWQHKRVTYKTTNITNQTITATDLGPRGWGLWSTFGLLWISDPHLWHWFFLEYFGVSDLSGLFLLLHRILSLKHFIGLQILTDFASCSAGLHSVLRSNPHPDWLAVGFFLDAAGSSILSPRTGIAAFSQCIQLFPCREVINKVSDTEKEEARLADSLGFCISLCQSSFLAFRFQRLPLRSAFGACKKRLFAVRLKSDGWSVICKIYSNAMPEPLCVSSSLW